MFILYNICMKPKEILIQWIDAFNKADSEKLIQLYDLNAIKQMFDREFSEAEMVCIPENIFEDGEWAILEWKDPLGLRGCGFFHIVNDKIIFQRGYWDKLSFLRMHNLPID